MMMLVLGLVAAAAAASALDPSASTSLATHAASFTTHVPRGEQEGGEATASGTWRGSFLQREWTFEFTNEEGRWSGRYIRSDGPRWHPLADVAIVGRSVSFSIASQPRIRFALELETGSRTMSGTVTIDGYGTVPFSAARPS